MGNSASSTATPVIQSQGSVKSVEQSGSIKAPRHVRWELPAQSSQTDWAGEEAKSRPVSEDSVKATVDSSLFDMTYVIAKTDRRTQMPRFRRVNKGTQVGDSFIPLVPWDSASGHMDLASDPPSPPPRRQPPPTFVDSHVPQPGAPLDDSLLHVNRQLLANIMALRR